MRRLGLDLAAFVISFAFQVFSAQIPKVSVVELRQRNHCFPALTNSSKMTNSYLWRIVRDPPVYFFGTIHVPYTRVWDYIPENTKQAFRESDHAFFELDLTDIRTTHTLRRCQMLPRGENLSTVLPERMYKRLKNHLGYVEQMMPTWGVYDEGLFHAIAGNWERKRPVWVMLMVNTLNEADMKSRGIPVLDYYLTLEAKRMDKGVGAVEYVQEQCIPFNGLNVSQVLFLLNRTLWQQEALRDGTVQNSFTTDDLIWHYNCGDLNSMIFSLDTAQIPSVLNSTMSQAEIALAQEIDRYFVNELIDKRNQNMASRIKEIVDSNRKESFFFAFGAGHFLGNNSILDLLRAEGFEIENIPADVDLNSLMSNSVPDTGQGPSEHRSTQQQWEGAERNSHFNELWVHINEIESEKPVNLNDKVQHITTTVPCNHSSGASGLHKHPSRTSTFLLMLLSIVTAILLTGTRRT